MTTFIVITYALDRPYLWVEFETRAPDFMSCVSQIAGRLNQDTHAVKSIQDQGPYRRSAAGGCEMTEEMVERALTAYRGSLDAEDAAEDWEPRQRQAIRAALATLPPPPVRTLDEGICSTCCGTRKVRIVNDLYRADYEKPCPTCIGWAIDSILLPAPAQGSPLNCLLCGRPNRDPRPWDRSSSICPDCEDREYRSPPPVQGDGDLREKVARMFDPGAMWDLAGVPGFPLADHYADRQERALAKADVLFALLPTPSPGLERLKAAARGMADVSWSTVNARRFQHALDELNLAARAFAAEEDK